MRLLVERTHEYLHTLCNVQRWRGSRDPIPRWRLFVVQRPGILRVGDSDNRTLTIDFLAGAEEIEIIGTTVIPEFGTIAVIILAVAIVSIIAVSSRTKLNVLPKY